MKYWVRSLWARADLAPHLRNDAGGKPRSHVTQSRGYREKVTLNPKIGNDPRNLALMGTTDGVPFFADQRRGGWCFVLRDVTLPDGLSMDPANVHLHLISANEHLENDLGSNTLRRKIRGPKSLHPHMSIIVDDLLDFYHNGTNMHVPICTHVYLYVARMYPYVPIFTHVCRIQM